ncbi:hypothetical protein FA95DRAFT_1607767 [Auriscalpium vulgare]|uniref:Uncharacterized protein n=1 Tax=Auriscalpium vulgare TaxID=40419 RepID=A0ACB8RMW8_9AGAM|nr:hypothetical protein FA95DRAFT_1607767 [Auriscalpium vulgare]
MPMRKRTAEDSVTLAARACEAGSLHECATALQALHVGSLVPVSDLSSVPPKARRSKKKSKSKSKTKPSPVGGSDTSGPVRGGDTSGPVRT